MKFKNRASRDLFEEESFRKSVIDRMIIIINI